MRGQYNGHCLGFGRWALILHGSHRELEPLKPAEDQFFHSPLEVLTLPPLVPNRQSFPSNVGPLHEMIIFKFKPKFRNSLKSGICYPTAAIPLGYNWTRGHKSGPEQHPFLLVTLRGHTTQR